VHEGASEFALRMTESNKLVRFGREPVGDSYGELLRFALAYATTFSLTMAYKATSSMLNALNELQPFELEVREVNEWPGTRLMPGRTAQLHVYQVNPESIARLEGLASGLFSWTNWDLPEDLIFYRADGSVIVGQVASEQSAWLELRDSELADLEKFPAIRRELLG
jgi:hypothetical protein